MNIDYDKISNWQTDTNRSPHYGLQKMAINKISDIRQHFKVI